MGVDPGLLRTRRFLPLFVTQFLGAFNDNFLKNAVVVLALTQAVAGGPGVELVGLLGGAALVFPFFPFSATAGQLADRFDKAMLARIVKAMEIPLMAAGAYGLMRGDLWFLLAVLLAIGIQSVFLGPIKYALLPAHLRDDELLAGNGLIESSTFLAILLGTIGGGVIVSLPGGPGIVAVTLVALSLAGFAASLFIPPAPSRAPDLRVEPNIAAATAAIVRETRALRGVWRAILGISWFWAAGGVLVGQLPAYVDGVLNADAHVFSVFLAMFTLGIAFGTFIAARLLKGEISARHAPLWMALMAAFLVDLYFATPAAPPSVRLALSDVLATPAIWRIGADLLGAALAGGAFVMPLYAIVQAWSPPERRARSIAANNIATAAMMTIATVVAIALGLAGVPHAVDFLILAALNLAVALIVIRLLPDEILKGWAITLLGWWFRVELRGRENAPKGEGPAIYVVNHVSLLDGPLLAAFLPGKPTFAVHSDVPKWWWAKPFLALVDVYPLDPTNPMATKALIRVVREGRQLVIFPEGRITVTGALMKIYDGPGMIADKAEAMVVPVRIDGAQFSKLSYLRGRLRLRWRPKITISILPPRKLAVPEALTGRERRRAVGRVLYDTMADMMFATSPHRIDLFTALLDARDLHGGGTVVVEDFERKLSFDQVIQGATVLGGRLAAISAPGEAVALLLPNAAATMVAFFALQAHARVPAMLNFAAGADNMAAACEAAQVKTIVTARRFIERAKLDGVVARLARDRRVVYLEDLRAGLSLGEKLRAKLSTRLARRWHRAHAPDAAKPAVILFTSGTEGAPKAVLLSHANIMANRQQLAARIDFNPADIVFNALPVFHSFGLTGGALLPILSGIRAYFYPSPLHYRIVPELVYGTNATIFFGTDTFLSGYARMANPYDFYSLRYVFAGAERVKPETRATWMDKFGLRILEGYGATETAPALATNTPMHFKAGTVGRLLPGIEHRLEPVPGVTGGRLLVKGPNVMLGYMRAERPGELDPPPDGWYDTGDIVTIDAEGFITIAGRAKRFAKIGGEMVSLAAVEAWAGEVWPGHHHACVALPDPRKGEQLVLVTERADAIREPLLRFAAERGIPELMIPRVFVPVDRLPLLATGKIDLRAVAAIAKGAADGPS